MWNLSLFREVKFFHRKISTVPALEISWNFNIFQNSPNFIKLAEHIRIIIRNMHVNLSPFREVNLFHRKMPTVPALYNIMKFQHFFKVHQISSNLQNILESSSETCMWNLSLFREVKFFHRKMLTVPALEISWNFNIFQSSQNYIKLAEHIAIIIRNMHVNLSPFREVNLFHSKMPTVPALEI